MGNSLSLAKHQAQPTACTVISASSPPATIRKKIVALDVAFPAGRSMSDDERSLRDRLYAVAIEGFEVYVADFVLSRLMLCNPRNPFAPTPQDVHELCRETQAAFHGAVRRFVAARGWELSNSVLPKNWFAGTSPEPFAPGCIVPDVIASEWCRQLLSCEHWHSYDYPPTLQALRRSDSSLSIALKRYTADFLNRLPDEALPDGYREAFQNAIRIAQEEDAKRRAEVEAMRERRMNKGTWEDWHKNLEA